MPVFLVEFGCVDVDVAFSSFVAYVRFGRELECNSTERVSLQ